MVVTHSILSPSTGSTSQHGFLLVPQFSSNNIVLNVMCSQFASVTALHGLDLWDFLELLRMFLPLPPPIIRGGGVRGRPPNLDLRLLPYTGMALNIMYGNGTVNSRSFVFPHLAMIVR